MPNEAMEQVEKGWLDGPSPLDAEGQLHTSDGPQVAQPTGARNRGRRMTWGEVRRPARQLSGRQ